MKNINWFIKDSEIEILAKENKISPIDPLHKHTIHYKDIMPDDQNINVMRHGRYKDIYLHNHDYFEIEYVLSGTMTTIIDGNEITLTKGDLIMLNPFCYHSIKKVSSEDTILNIILRTEFLPHFISLFNSANNYLFEFITESTFYKTNRKNHIYTKADKNVDEQLIDFINLFNPDIKLNQSIARLKMCEILLNMSELYYIDHSELDNNYESQIIIKTYQYINQNVATANLSEIAKQLNMTDYNLSRLFKKVTKKTFLKEVQKIRIKKANELLLSTDLKIDEIAIKVGYENQTFFYKKFKEYFLDTPRNIRNKNIGRENEIR